jgi:glucosamine--fructose-6-phosphate aminotransferase (isomerizing)
MCGIFGIVTRRGADISTQSVDKLVRAFFTYSELRGMESSGIVIKDPIGKEMLVCRRSTKGRKFVNTSEFEQLVNKHITKSTLEKGLSILGHTRIATNGMLGLDNQPIVKNGSIGIHNGIICNIDYLWKDHPELHRQQLIDTELLVGLIKDRLDRGNANAGEVLSQTIGEIEGTASFGLMFDNYKEMLLGSNCGSFYYALLPDTFAFASEDFILESCLKDSGWVKEGEVAPIHQLEPVSFGVLNPVNFTFDRLTNESSILLQKEENQFKVVDLTTEVPKLPFLNTQPESRIRAKLEFNEAAVKALKRCTRCILPETHPFIDFDEKGVCNYCREYDRRPKIITLGKEKLLELVAPLKKGLGVNSMLLLSGGRDSCYAMHVMKEELGLNPVAYSYDWGMLTDLGRRNQARMCGKLGVEHILISADIRKKREYIKLNVEAWLKKPHLGMVGLFMAGDKAYHYYAQQLYKRTKLPLFNGGSPLEFTYFKHGFSGARPSFEKKTFKDKLDIMGFFVNQAITNPKYLNESNWDSLMAYFVYFFYKWDTIPITMLFRYLPWDEAEVNRTLIDGYNWELSPDTPTTWRIGDGTTAFYNYIYHTVAGFTENDCLRSNQINEGVMTRERALELVYAENRPRYESLKWYFDTIGVDMESAIDVVNKMPKLFAI